jgi:hypothetical protein
VALKKLKELLSKGPLNMSDPATKQLIEEIAANSFHGSGNVIALGMFTDYDSGYVLYGRYLERAEDGSRYYHSHPEIYPIIAEHFGSDTATKDLLLWTINEKALLPSVGSRIPVEYSLFDIPNSDLQLEKDTLIKLFDTGNELKNSGASNAVIGNKLDEVISNAYGRYPGRMKELKLLFLNGYTNYIFDSVLNAYKITP